MKIKDANLEVLKTLTEPFMTQAMADRFKAAKYSFNRFLIDCLWAPGHSKTYPIVEGLYRAGCNDEHISAALRAIAKSRNIKPF